MSQIALSHRPLDLVLRHTFRISRGASDMRHNLLVELREGELTGRGEAAPILRYGEDRASATAAVVSMAARLGEARHFSHVVARAAVPGQRAAQAALDIALHDLAAQRFGVPVHAMLGLDPGETPLTSFTIGMDRPDVVAAKVKEASGYPILKVKLGSDADREILAAVRDTTDRPGGRASRGRRRDLHRRRGRLHHRPPACSRRPKGLPHFVRRNARDGESRRGRHAFPLD